MRSIRSPGAGALRAPVSLAILLSAAVFLFSGMALAQGPDPDRFIVKFAEGKGPQGRALLLGANAELLLELGPQNAAAARIPAQALAGLANNPNIEYIERDPPRYPMAQTLPYGVPMVQADPYGRPGRLGPATRPRSASSIPAMTPTTKTCRSITGDDVAGWGRTTSGTPTPAARHARRRHHRGSRQGQWRRSGILGVGPKRTSRRQGLRRLTCSWSYASNRQCVDASNKCRGGKSANIINMSLGLRPETAVLEHDGKQWLPDHYDNGILSIAAAGNAGNTQKSYPASYASVISVAAVDSKAVADFSQKNDAVELSASRRRGSFHGADGMGTSASLSVALP
jgi:serine protease